MFVWLWFLFLNGQAIAWCLCSPADLKESHARQATSRGSESRSEGVRGEAEFRGERMATAQRGPWFVLCLLIGGKSFMSGVGSICVPFLWARFVFWCSWFSSERLLGFNLIWMYEYLTGRVCCSVAATLVSVAAILAMPMRVEFWLLFWIKDERICLGTVAFGLCCSCRRCSLNNTMVIIAITQVGLLGG